VSMKKELEKENNDMIKNFVKIGNVRKSGDLYELNRVKNPYLPNKYGVLRWKLWDQQLFTNAGGALANRIAFFTVPDGSQGRTKYDTNMQEISQLPAPQKFKVMGIEIMFTPASTRADVQAFLQRYYWEFIVGERTYAEGHSEDAPSGGGLTGFDTANNTALFTNGFPQVSNVYRTFVDPMSIGQEDSAGGAITTTGYDGIDINTSERFYLQFRNNNTTFTPDNDLGIRVNLCGYLARSVQ